jgi:hypothetical protein
VDAILVGVAEEAITDEVGASVSDETITFHLSHAQATIPGTTFQWLAGKHGNWATRARMDLVIDLLE